MISIVQVVPRAHSSIVVENDHMEPDEPSKPKQRVNAACNQSSPAEPLNLLDVDARCERAVTNDAEQVNVETELDAELEVFSDVGIIYHVIRRHVGAAADLAAYF